MSEKRYPYCKFTIMEEKQIIEEYQAGASMASLGKKWNCDPSTIKNILKAYQVSARTLSQARKNFLKETLNEHVFEKIDKRISVWIFCGAIQDVFIHRRFLFAR